MSYSLRHYGQMISSVSRHRADAYVAAIRQTVRPGSVVIDLGSGPGFFAILAAQLGAAKVYAVDPSPTIELGRRLAAANGVADRVTFFRGLSTNLELPERADVIVADLRGQMPWLDNAIPSMIDARERLLAPDGVLIPFRDEVVAAVVDVPNAYDRIVGPWVGDHYGVDLRLGLDQVLNVAGSIRLKPADLVTEAMPVAVIDYATITGESIQSMLKWTVPAPRQAHGLGMWFHTQLTPGPALSAGPAGTLEPYSQLFLPWSEPVSLQAGDSVEVEFRREIAPNGPVMTWHTKVARGPEKSIVAKFAQGTFGRP